MTWFALTGDERITKRCATERCGGQPTWRLEVDGVGSDYCPGCKAKIDEADRRRREHLIAEMAREAQELGLE